MLNKVFALGHRPVSVTAEAGYFNMGVSVDSLLEEASFMFLWRNFSSPKFSTC